MNAALSATILASWLPTLPSFDTLAATVVGIIVAVGAVLVIWMAIATPFVAIQRGASVFGTFLAVLFIGLATGGIAAVAAGFYWGRAGDLKRAEHLERVKHVANKLDIYFETPNNEPLGTNLQDTTLYVVSYRNQGTDQSPEAAVTKTALKALSRGEFEQQVIERIKLWLQDHPRGVRHITVFMKPDPGQGFYRSIVRAVPAEEGVKVGQTESTWESALDRKD